jgi:hypothetical protein
MLNADENELMVEALENQVHSLRESIASLSFMSDFETSLTLQLIVQQDKNKLAKVQKLLEKMKT